MSSNENKLGKLTPQLVPWRLTVPDDEVELVFSRRGFGDDDPINLFSYQREFPSYGWSDEADAALIEQWMLSGNCPDPFFYEVTGSELTQDFRCEDSQWKHYLLASEEVAVHVVASRVTADTRPLLGTPGKGLG